MLIFLGLCFLGYMLDIGELWLVQSVLIVFISISRKHIKKKEEVKNKQTQKCLEKKYNLYLDSDPVHFSTVCIFIFCFSLGSSEETQVDLEGEEEGAQDGAQQL